MSLFDAIALAGLMVTLAALPSASVALVVTRAATGGFASGAAVAAGIVLGDLVFVALALLGITALSEWAGSLFSVLRGVGGVYLLWVGLGLLRPGDGAADSSHDAVPPAIGLAASFSAGLLLTLGDIKAIVFYASLFPAFVGDATPGVADIALIIAVTVIAVGGVKGCYAAAASRIAGRFQRMQAGVRPLRLLAGLLIVLAGLAVIAGAL